MKEINTTHVAHNLVNHAERLGYEFDRFDGSKLSDSMYVYLFLDELKLKIRISNHKLCATYERDNGRVDYEIGFHDMAMGDWLDCLAWLAKKAGKPEPKIIQLIRKAQITRENNQKLRLQKSINSRNRRIIKEILEKKDQIIVSKSRSAKNWYLEMPEFRIVLPVKSAYGPFCKDSVINAALATYSNEV